MTRDGRLLLLLLCLLIAYDLLAVECRYHNREDVTTTLTEARHRHRHKHDASARRSYHDLDRKTWQEIDYEYYGDSDDSTDEDDYETQSYYNHPRSHQRSIQRGYHSRIFEPRYPVRHHHGSGYHGNAWYNADNNDRRRIPSRYNTKNHRYRSNSRVPYYRPAVYSRNHDSSEYDDDTREDFDYERPYRYSETEGADKHHEWWRNTRRYAFPRRDRANRMSNGYRSSHYNKHRFENHDGIIDRDDTSRWTDNWRRRSNLTEGKFHYAKDSRRMEVDDDDYEDHGGLEEADKDDDEDDIWKDIEDEVDEEEESDNDFYKSEKKPPLTTYDDIIRRLTSDEPVTPKVSTKRGYRNIEVAKHVRHDGHGYLKHESRNITRPMDPVKITSALRTSVNYFMNKQITAENSTVKSVADVDGRKPQRNAIIGVANTGNDDQREKSTVTKSDDTQTKIKSLEQDYDEYLNVPDNEKDEDLVKDGIEDSAMQADVTNTVSVSFIIINSITPYFSKIHFFFACFIISFTIKKGYSSENDAPPIAL